jgi:hypothetical protein
MNSCKACGSTRVLTRPAGHLGSRSFVLGAVQAVLVAPQDSRESSAIEALVCVECGHVWLQATDLRGLRAAYERIAAGDVKFSRDESDT